MTARLFCAEKTLQFFRKTSKPTRRAAVPGIFFEVECLKSDPKRIIFDFSAVLGSFDTKCMKLYTRIMRCGARKARKFIEKERYPWQ